MIDSFMLRERMEKLHQKIYPAYAAVRRGMGSFAAHWLSFPVLFLFAFGSVFLISFLEGYRLFGLNVSIWVYQFYLCDYKVGFCSRLLIGAVITHFTDIVSTDLMNTIINTAVVLSLFLQSLIVAVILRIAMKRGSMLGCFITLLFLCNPLAVTENMRMPGQIDVYLLVLFLLWSFSYRTPLVYIVSPLICFVCMAIHYEFVLTFLPPMLILLLYRAVAWPNKRARFISAFTFVLCAIISAVLLIWFVFFSTSHLRLTEDEFYYNMLRRFQTDPVTRSANIYKMGTPIYKEFFDTHLFGHIDFSPQLFGDHAMSFSYNNPFEYLKLVLTAPTLGSPAEWMKEFILLIPGTFVLTAIWVICVIREKKGKRFVYICCAAQFMVLFPEIIISTDGWRFISATFIAQFAVFFAVYCDKDSDVNQLLRV